VSTIRSLCLGVSAHQKLDHLQHLVHLLGYESLAVFGDCFDEVRASSLVSRRSAQSDFPQKKQACLKYTMPCMPSSDEARSRGLRFSGL
jgi:hypothetical protein